MKTYHDVFVEQLVRRHRPGGETMFRVGAAFLGLILITLAFVLVRHFFQLAPTIVLIRIFFPALIAVVVILEFFAFVYTVKEFEYSFINGDLDVDMIRGKRKRSTVFSVSWRDIVLMAPAGTRQEALQESFTRTLDASVGPRDPDRWFFIVQRQDGTRELVYLSPNDRLLEAFAGYLGRKMDYSPDKKNTLPAE